MFWFNDLVLAFGITGVAIAIVVSMACYVWMEAPDGHETKKSKRALTRPEAR